jgi:broad specificity phosphatase PhoE
METCYIYVVRHGESVYNRDDVVSGQNNPKLTALGRQQANETKAKLAKIKFDEVYSSDLQRASDTAAIIF